MPKKQQITEESTSEAKETDLIKESETVNIDITPSDILKKQFPNRALINNDSIHTIKEGDFAKEEDETMHEE